MGKVITICQNKGGVGKTTLTFNLAECIAKRGNSVLLIDTDAQANLTGYILGSDIDDSKPMLFDSMIKDKKISPWETSNRYISIVPADLRLSDIDFALAQVIARETILSNKLSSIKENYDYIIIDTAPNLGLLTINSILCSDNLLVPMIPEPFSLQGWNMINTLLGRLKTAINKTIKTNIVLQKVKNTALHKEIEEQLRLVYGDKVLKQTIRDGIKYAEKSVSSEMKNTYDYISLTDEFLQLV